jgi:WD40 repeat protein
MNGEVRLWYAPTSQELATIKTGAQLINALVFSPDGRKLYAGSRDGKLMWWGSE